MNERKLPNATTSLVLGIISFIACCISSGFGGIVLSGIALYLSNKDRKRYFEEPEEYDNFNQVKTARIIAIIGLILGILTLVSVIIFVYSLGGIEGYKEWFYEQTGQTI